MLCAKPREGRIGCNCPQQPVRVVVGWTKEEGSRGGDQGKPALPAERDGLMHRWAGRQLHIEVFVRILAPGGQGCAVVREDHQAGSMSGDRGDEVEGLITVASREDLAQVGVAARGLREQHCPARLVNKFRADDGLKACVPRHLEEPDGAIQPVRVRESQPVLALGAHRLA